MSLPTGRNKYLAHSGCGKSEETIYLGFHETINEAFLSYKKYKENLIRQIAIEEYIKGNITKGCYDAMMNYEVEITD